MDENNIFHNNHSFQWNNTYFDTGSGVSVYNNKGGGTVTHTRVDAKAQNSPFAGILMELYTFSE